jgi:uncharacterized protein DUF3987
MMVLGVLATGCQRKFFVEIDPGYVEPLNVWPIAGLDSGNRKTAVLSAATRPLMEWAREQQESMQEKIAQAKSERETCLARIQALRVKAARTKSSADFAYESGEIARLESELPQVPKPPQLWTQDVTPERLGAIMSDNNETMSIISDEGGVFDILAGRYSNGIPNLDLFLQSHAGSPIRVDRGSRPPVVMDHPALTIVLSPQPDLLHGLASKPGFRGRGLLARFLYVLPVSRLGYRTGRTSPVPSTVSTEYAEHVRALLKLKTSEAGPSLIRLSAEARRELAEFNCAVEHDMRDGERFEHIRDWAGKLPGAAARIAGLFHCADNVFDNPAEAELSFDTMWRALEFATVLSVHALAAFDLMGADLSLKSARKVWAWIKRQRRTTFRARDCFNALRGTFPRTSDLEPAIEVLLERAHIAEKERDARVGRPTRVFEVNPALSESWD